MINNTSDFFYVTPVGAVHRGDDPPPPDGSTLLVAPGSQIQDDLAKRYGIYDRLLKAGTTKVARDSKGEPLVMRADGRAMAAHVLPDDDEGKQAAMKAAEQEADDDEDEPEAGAKVKPAAQGKAVRLDKEDGVEDKAVAGPKKAPAKPTPKGK